MLTNQITEYWERQGPTQASGATESQIRTFENRFDVVLPDGLRRLYSAANGSLRPDSEMNILFWPLGEIDRAGSLDPKSRSGNWAFVFADHLDESWLYGIDLDGSGPGKIGAIYMIGAPDTLFIAYDFDEFAQLYLEKDERLLSPALARAFSQKALSAQDS